MLPRKLQLLFIFLVQLVFISLFQFKSNYEEKNIASVEVQTSRVPRIEYENARRKIIQDTKDLLWYLESRLTNLSPDNSIENILNEARTRKNVILSKFHDMLEYDGYNTWREREHFELSNIVQNRIHAAQNPENSKSPAAADFRTAARKRAASSPKSRCARSPSWQWLDGPSNAGVPGFF